jgi:hypothetical protein
VLAADGGGSEGAARGGGGAGEGAEDSDHFVVDEECE